MDNRLRLQTLFNNYGMPGMDDMYGDQSMNQVTSQPYEDPFYVRNEVDRIARQVQGPPIQDTPDYSKMFETINKIYTPDYTARDRFGRLLDNFPERNDPGFGRKFTASMVALGDPAKGGGIQGAENVMYAPYMRDLQAWKEQTGPNQAAAQQENTANSIERQLASNAVTGMYNQDRLETQRRNVDEQQATIRQRDQDRFRIDQAKLEIQKLIQTQGVKEILDKGVNVVLVMNDGRTIDTGVATTNYSPIEIENLKAQHAVTLKQTIPGVNPLSVRPGAGGAGGATRINPKDVSDTVQNELNQALATIPGAEQFIGTNEADGSLRLLPPPEDPIALHLWQRIAQKVYPNAQMPDMSQGAMPPRAAPIQGTPGQNMTPIPPGYRPGGLGPSAPPQQAPIRPPQAPNFSSFPQVGGPGRGVVQDFTQPGAQAIAPQTAIKPGQMTYEQQQAGLAAGTLLEIQSAVGGEIGYIPNTLQSIESAKQLGWNIIPRKR